MKNREKIKITKAILSSTNGLKENHLTQACLKVQDICKKYEQIRKNSRLMNEAVKRSWFMSAVTAGDRINRDISELFYVLNRLKIPTGKDVSSILKFRDIYSELEQLEQELGTVVFDPESMAVSVVTESITLEEICLGPFEVKLFINDLSDIGRDCLYKVIALDPNPAGSNSEVTHPHVSCEALCEGDGSASIVQALGNGRVCDFFIMVVNILKTYNPEDPYISLSEWAGMDCYNCDRTISEEDTYYCECCDHDFCSGCSTYCQRCEITICMDCAIECPICKNLMCEACTVKCVDCGNVFCKDCLDDELCPACEGRKEQEDEECNSEDEQAA